MRLKQFLFTVGMQDNHFNSLRRLDNLPFTEDSAFAGWANFSVEDAFRMRVMLDLIGEDYRQSEYLAGLPASYAQKIVINAVRGMACLPHGREDADIWAGVLVARDDTAPGGASPIWFWGGLADLAGWVAAKTLTLEGEAPMPPVRVFLANASEAARGVRERAKEIGVFDEKEAVV